MLHHIFSKKLIHLLNVTGKILTFQNLNLISSRWNTKFVMQFKSTQCLPLPRFCKKPSCKLPSRTRPSIIKLGTNSICLEITHVIDMVLPCNHKGFFLKMAAPKRQAKSLKTIFSTFASYTPGMYEKQFFHKHFFRVLLKFLVMSSYMEQ